MFEHKGYYGSVDYSEEDKLLCGKVEFVRGLLSYEGSDIKSLNKNFKKVVDDYLDYCNEEGIEPQKPFKGSFNVRTGSDLHRRAALYAKEQEVNLNKVVVEALENYLPPNAA